MSSSSAPSTAFPSSPSMGSRRDAPPPLNLPNSSPRTSSSPLPFLFSDDGHPEPHLHAQHLLRQTPSKLRDERTWSMSSIPIFLDSPGEEGLADFIGGVDAASGIPDLNHPLDVDIVGSDGSIPSPRRNLLPLNSFAGPLTPAYGRVPLPCRESIASSSGFSSATSPTATPQFNELALDLGLLPPPARRRSSDSRAGSPVGGGGEDDNKSLFSLSEYYAREDNKGDDREEGASIREEDTKALSARWHRNLDSPISPVEPNPFYSVSCGPSPLSSACPLPTAEYAFPRSAASPRHENNLEQFTFPAPAPSAAAGVSMQPCDSSRTIVPSSALLAASPRLAPLSPRFPSSSPHLSAPNSSNASTPTRSTHDYDSTAALLSIEDLCPPCPVPIRSKSTKAGPPVSFATPNVNRSISEQIPATRTHRTSSSYSGPRSRNSMYNQLGKEISIELWIDQEGFRAIRPHLTFVRYNPSIPLDSIEATRPPTTPKSAKGRGRASSIGTPASSASPIRPVFDIPSGHYEFGMKKRQSWPFHHAPLDRTPVLRRLTLGGDDSRDYLGRQGDIQLKNNGVYTLRGTEDKGSLEWKLEYEITDRLGRDGRVVPGEKNFPPLSFCCTPELLDRTRRGQKHNLLNTLKKSVVSNLSSEKLELPLHLFFPTPLPSSTVTDPLTPARSTPFPPAEQQGSIVTNSPSPLARTIDLITKPFTPSSSPGRSRQASSRGGPSNLSSSIGASDVPLPMPTSSLATASPSSTNKTLPALPVNSTPLRKRSNSLSARLRPWTPPSSSSPPPPLPTPPSEKPNFFASVGRKNAKMAAAASQQTPTKGMTTEVPSDSGALGLVLGVTPPKLEEKRRGILRGRGRPATADSVSTFGRASARAAFGAAP